MATKLTRRDFLQVAGFTSLAAALWGCSGFSLRKASWIPVIPSPTATPVSSDPLAAVLHRITFGPRPSDLNRAKQVGLTAFLEEQLSPETLPDPAVEVQLSGLDTLAMNPGALQAVKPVNRPALELIRATLIREVYSTGNFTKSW